MRPAPLSSSIIVAGIVFSAACPPLFIVFFSAAIIVQGISRARRRKVYDAAYAKAAARSDREYHEALRYFAS